MNAPRRGQTRWRLSGLFGLTLVACHLDAAESPLIEEILVTAQRIEENAQKVPMAVSAFDDLTIRDRQIIQISDLQLNVPNLAYVPDNFVGARIAIRGIGDILAEGGGRTAGGPAVPLHVNGISVPVDVTVLEFYDLERDPFQLNNSYEILAGEIQQRLSAQLHGLKSGLDKPMVTISSAGFICYAFKLQSSVVQPTTPSRWRRLAAPARLAPA